MHSFFFIPVIIFFSPVCCGMVRAFYGGRAAGRMAYDTSAGVWYGYGKGVAFSIYLFFAEMVLFSLYILLQDGLKELLEIVMMTIASTFLYILFTGFAASYYTLLRPSSDMV